MLTAVKWCSWLVVFAWLIMLIPRVVSAQDAPDLSAEQSLTMAIALIALGASEALALIPSLKANGLLHAIILILRKLRRQHEDA